MAIIERPVDQTDVVLDLTVNCPPGATAIAAIAAISGYCSSRPTEDGRVAVRFERLGATTGDVVNQLRAEIEQRAGTAVVAVATVS